MRRQSDEIAARRPPVSTGINHAGGVRHVSRRIRHAGNSRCGQRFPVSLSPDPKAASLGYLKTVEPLARVGHPC